MYRTDVRKVSIMSALEASYFRSSVARRSHLHLVQEGETPAHYRRKVYAQEMSREKRWDRVSVYVNLVSAFGFFTTALTTFALCYFSIPHTPLL